MFMLLLPGFTAIFAFLVLGEPVTLNMFLGLAIISLGFYVAVK